MIKSKRSTHHIVSIRMRLIGVLLAIAALIVEFVCIRCIISVVCCCHFEYFLTDLSQSTIGFFQNLILIFKFVEHNENSRQKFRTGIWFSIDFHFDIFYYRSTVVDFRIASD